MGESEYAWKCTNHSCDTINHVPRERILRDLSQKRPIVLICVNCGYISNFDYSARLDQSSEGFECVPWTGGEQREPSGKISEGWITVLDKKPLSTLEFMKKYGVDPEINWDYQHRL